VARWQIITGEYPPQFGGVADYTRLVARGLAAAGDDVTIWAPYAAHASGPENDDGIRVGRISDHFGRRGLSELNHGIDRRAQILVQYVPHAYGMKAMNVPFSIWLFGQRRGDVSVMFHEVAYPFVRGQAVRLNTLAAVHRAMAAIVARAAKRIFIAAEEWRALLRPYVPASCPITWTPVPSNIPLVHDREAVMSRRARYAERGETIIGHFGNYGVAHSAMLRDSLLPILESNHNVKLLLIGRNSERFGASLAALNPSFASRLHATGIVDSRDVSVCISACDLMLQPYPGGITTRNASAIAALAHARPVVTNAGPLTENLWPNSNAVVALRSEGARELGIAALDLARDRERVRAMGCAAAALNSDVFDLRHTLRALGEN
jgi:glycosyltransferase involved in cell wall biosynthesis